MAWVYRRPLKIGHRCTLPRRADSFDGDVWACDICNRLWVFRYDIAENLRWCKAGPFAGMRAMCHGWRPGRTS